MIAVIAAGCGLKTHFAAESVDELHTRQVLGVIAARFDERTDTWLLQTESGDEHRAGIVVDERQSQSAATTPTEFGGPSTVTMFDRPPTVQARNTKWRWRRRPQHHLDAVVDTTGSDATYLGIARHGVPNWFRLSGPDSPQLRYIVECLDVMARKGATRVEVRRSAQRQFAERGRVKRPARAFEFTAADATQKIYDGPATLTVAGHDHDVRVRLTGHLDPIDGKYHWQGTVFDVTTELPSGPIQTTIDTRTMQARITEQTPWGSYSIAGVGTPPFG